MPEENLPGTRYHGSVELGFDDFAFIVASSILASVALLSRSVPVLIGAMILAPVFDPLIAVPFGLVRKEWHLMLRGLFNSALLLATSGLVCFVTVAAALHVEAVPSSLSVLGPDMVTERLVVGWHSFMTAVVAGTGGAIAFAANRRENIVGVAVALALIPAIAASAIGFNYGLPGRWGGLVLVMVNVAGIVFAGTVTLLIRGSVVSEREHD